MNFKFAIPYDQENIDDLANAVDEWVVEGVKALMRDTVVYQGVTVRGLTDAIDLEGTNVDGIGAGTLSGGALPNNVSFCISLRTGLTGRSARGRFYVPPFDTAQMFDINHVTGAFAAAWVSQMNQLRTVAGAVGWTQVVVSRQQGLVVPANAVARPVTEVLAVTTRVASQRGRLPKPT